MLAIGDPLPCFVFQSKTVPHDDRNQKSVPVTHPVWPSHDFRRCWVAPTIVGRSQRS